ncbi:MAG: N-acetylmuramoyl-L-alanine amidase, partial [Fimbriimonas ginsengisoli]|nr:N-acetylmuramoyl-L-alanine amidase [Fimbriimonas ginsengisoli]
MVCIDPGHPSEVGPGTRGLTITELHAAWVTALLLKERLETAGLTVVLTKGREKQKVFNRKRAETANRAAASLMVRLHCDASSGSGYAIYFPDRMGTHQGHRGPSKQIQVASRAAAKAFHDAFALKIGRRLRDNGLLPD